MINQQCLSLPVLAICSLIGSSPLSAATCSADEKSLQSQIDSITTSYGQKFDSRRQLVEQESQKIRDDAPKPNAVTGTLKFDIDVKWNVQEIKLHIPEFKMEDRKMSYDIPKMELKQQTWIYHTPSVRMEPVCMNKPPETVCEMVTRCIGGGWSKICTDIPSCRTRAGGQMCTDLPKPFMQEQKTILGVPEITGTSRQEIVVGIPVVEMKLQSWKLSVPEFTVKNISAETQKTKDRAAELQVREKNANTALSDSMQGEIKQASAENISSVFTCQSADLKSSKESALNDIDANINTIKASIDSAVKFGATAMRDSMQKALDDMMSAREKTLASFIESENKLNEQKKIEMDKILNTKI